MAYDGFNKKVLQRSYHNLDPFYFSYVYSGPLISVNGDSNIVVERGTQTKDLYISFVYPSALNLTFIPKISTFSLLPKEIKILVKIKFH